MERIIAGLQLTTLPKYYYSVSADEYQKKYDSRDLFRLPGFI
jgi:hypothetical protein